MTGSYCVDVGGVPFGSVEPASQVHPVLVQLRDAIGADHGLTVDADASVRAEVLPRVPAGGNVELVRCYWSVQRSDPSTACGFTARTLHWDRRTGVSVVDFPADPAMDWVAGPGGPLSGHGERARVRVLRYIPLRRVTFLLDGADGLPARVVAKTKRRVSLIRATKALVTARRAMRRGDESSFRVPEPIQLEADRRLLYLAELPGRALAALLASGQIDTDEAMHRVGRIHRAVHELGGGRLPVRGYADWLATTSAAGDRIAALAPSSAGRVGVHIERLAATVPDREDLAFCHGDFDPSQILCDTSRWAVLDLDDAHRADPHAEVAALFVALGSDLPPAADVEAARRAYLDGYVARAGEPLDADRWRWFLAVARLEQLAHRLVKCQALPGEVAATLDQLDRGDEPPAGRGRSPVV
jgi:aminoglycoside phosphotransferase